MAVVGRVAILPKGIWNIAATYDQLDTVSHNNALYLAIQKSTGINPETDTNGTYWQLCVSNADMQSKIDDIVGGTTTVEKSKTAEKATVSEKLETARKIGNAEFDGTKDVTLEDVGAEQLLTKSITGTSLHLTDTLAGKCEVKVPHNLLKKVDIETHYHSSNVSANSDSGTITIRQLHQDTFFGLGVNVDAGKFYTISADVSGNLDDVYTFYLREAQKGPLLRIDDVNKRVSVTILALTTSEYIMFDDLTRPVTNTGNTITLSNIMIEEGNVAHDYVPHEYSVKSCTKNLLSKHYSQTVTSLGGNTYELLGDGSIRITGTKNGFSVFDVLGYVDKLPANLEKGETYTFSVQENDAGIVVNVYYKIAGSGWKSVGEENSSRNSITFVLEPNWTSLLLRVNPTVDNVAVDIIVSPMLEKGFKRTEYIPNSESSVLVTSDTVYLNTFTEETNIFNDYNAEMTVTYGITETGNKLITAEANASKTDALEKRVNELTAAVLELQTGH